MIKREYCAITGFRARHKIPVADLRLFVATLKRKL